MLLSFVCRDSWSVNIILYEIQGKYKACVFCKLVRNRRSILTFLVQVDLTINARTVFRANTTQKTVIYCIIPNRATIMNENEITFLNYFAFIYMCIHVCTCIHMSLCVCPACMCVHNCVKCLYVSVYTWFVHATVLLWRWEFRIKAVLAVLLLWVLGIK